MELNYVDFEVGTRIAIRDIEKAVREARTAREYVLVLARVMSKLNDPHVYFVNLSDYYRQHGLEMQSCFHKFAAHGGHYWVILGKEHIVEGIDTSQWSSDRQLFELVSVDGVAPPLALNLLYVQEAEHAHIVVIDKDGMERQISVCGAPEASAPTIEQEGQPSLQDRVNAALSADPEVAKLGDIKVNIKHISISGFDEQIEKAMEATFSFILDSDVLVIDLRANRGGQTRSVEAVLSKFITRPTPYAQFEWRHRVRIIDAVIPIWYRPLVRVEPRAPIYRKPIVVLTDTGTVSGGEILAAALHDLRGARIVGYPTAGGGGFIGHVRLPDGLDVAYTAGRVLRLDGSAIQYVGVLPDVRVELDYDRIINGGEDALRESRDAVFFAGCKEAVRMAVSVKSRPPL